MYPPPNSYISGNINDVENIKKIYNDLNISHDLDDCPNITGKNPFSCRAMCLTFPGYQEEGDQCQYYDEDTNSFIDYNPEECEGLDKRNCWTMGECGWDRWPRPPL